MDKIAGGRGGGPVESWDDFERYARWVADDPKISKGLALGLVEAAAIAATFKEGAYVSVFTHDGRFAYVGRTPVPLPRSGRAPVFNIETGETVDVPVSALAPYGAEFDCDCDRCGEIWEGSRLA